MDGNRTAPHRRAWNKGELVGQKAPFTLQEIWAIRIRLQMQGRVRDLALFDLGIDSKLRACDLVKLRVRDVCHGPGRYIQPKWAARSYPIAAMLCRNSSGMSLCDLGATRVF